VAQLYEYVFKCRWFKFNETQMVKKLLKQGLSASCADYDKRTALMVAAQEGREVS
jgi:ankyrin repeat protein